MRANTRTHRRMRALAHDRTGAVEHGDGPALPCGEVDGPRVRVRTATFATPWLPDTPSQRHLTVVWGRLVRDEADQPGCTVPAGAGRVGRANRPAASPHREDVRPGGADVRALVWRQRQVETTVVDGVVPALRQTPGAGPTELVARVNAPLGRDDRQPAPIARAFEQISWVPVRRTLRRQLAAGHVPSQAAWLVTERLEHGSPPARPPASWGVPGGDGGRRLADPTALAARVTPELPLAQVPGSLCWLTCLLTRFSGHVAGSVWGRWGGVHQTTLGRWGLGLALAGWPLIARWVGERGRASMVDGDATWLQIRGRWHDGFVVLEVPPEGPVLAVLLPSRGPWACRGVDWPLRQRKHVPQVLSTEGGPA